MKKFTSLLIGCCLALAGAALAQQPVEQQTPKEKPAAQPAEKQAAPQKGRGQRAERRAGTNAAENPQQENAGQNQGQGQGTPNARGGHKGQKAERMPKAEAGAASQTTGADQSAAPATPNAKQPQTQEGRKGRNARGMNAKTAPNATPATAPSASAAPGTAGAASATTATAPTAAPTVAATGQQNANAQMNASGRAKRPDPQVVQQIKQQHTDFRAQPKPQQVPAVTFNQSYRIEGSDRWQGPQYEVFRSYHPERHDQGWYRSHYQRVELIGGGYYYWNNGYWYPAWGYSPQAEYYAYDGPIYVGHRAEPPDRVIADVQAVLQQMGYYKGEVDGLLGPLTREALTAYQADNGLTPTAAIDEPTLDSLQMG